MHQLICIVCDGCGFQYNKDVDLGIFHQCNSLDCDREVCTECGTECSNCFNLFCEDHIEGGPLCETCTIAEAKEKGIA